MYNIKDIIDVHLEISSRCNARCPLCPRNFYGYPHNNGYIEHDMTLSEAQKIFPRSFVTQLRQIMINGNFGDIVMNSESVDIVRWFREVNPRLQIVISTNGGARDKEFWQDLAATGSIMEFCIDGLEDTHHLYRQGTLYSTVIRNAQHVIEAGGRAVWKMLRFEHNSHQVDTARELSKQLGFEKFIVKDNERGSAPAFDRDGNLSHVIGSPKDTEFNMMFQRRREAMVMLEDVVRGVSKTVPINCEVKQSRSLYVSSIGDVYPCCYIGFNPSTFGRGSFYQPANAQLAPMVRQNNALEHDLETCINWFRDLEKTWSIETLEQGRPLICTVVCGTSAKNK